MKWSSKKGQIGMIEMIMVMVVVMILLVIGMVFYFKFSAAHTEKVGEKVSEERASVIVSTIVQLPEIECTYLGSRTSKACADVLKLLALSEKDGEMDIEHRRHYSNLFGYMTIKFEQLCPPTTGKECSSGNPKLFMNPGYPEIPSGDISCGTYPEIPPAEMSCGTWTIYDNPRKGAIMGETPFRSMPIALYYPIALNVFDPEKGWSEEMYAFGQLKIYIY